MRGLLGEGAFGAVYLARTTGGGIRRDVAIKVLHPGQADRPERVVRLRDEARMLALIRHRAIVRVDDLVELDGNWSIVMEYVEGCDVTAILRRGALAPAVALAIAEEVANALHAAWNQPGPDGRPLRLIHRDIKPGNVRITASGEVKVLDFGVARADFAERESATTQTSFGTLPYMAPERFEGRDTHASDLYALGVFLFEMLTGVTPGKTAADADRQPPGRRFTEQWAYLAGLSPSLLPLVAGMLAYDPERRPTAGDCARALADLRGELRGERIEDWAARTIPPVLAAGLAAIAPPDARTGSILMERAAGASLARAPGRGRVLPWAVGIVAAGVGVVGLALLGGAGAWWVSRDGEATAGILPSSVGAPNPDLPPAVDRTGPPVPVHVEAAGTPAPVPSTASDSPAPTAPIVAAPQPVAAPRNIPTRRPTPASEGTLWLAGDPVQARLTGPNGPVEAGRVPAGTYTAVVTFASGATVTIRDIGVAAGRVTRLTCKADFGNCRPTVEDGAPGL